MIIEKIKAWKQNLNDNEKDWIYLGLPVLISLLIKILLLVVLYDSPIKHDGVIYINAARQHAIGNFTEGMRLYAMPLYPMLIAFVHIFISDWIVAGYLISIMSMVIVTIPLYYLTKEMFGAKAGFWACLLFSVLPSINKYSLCVLRDPLFLLLLVACIYCALRSTTKKNPVFFSLTFFLAWGATLIRIEGVIFLMFYFFVLFYLLIVENENRSYFISRLLIWVGVPLGIALIALLSSGIRGIVFTRFDFIVEKFIGLFNGDFLANASRIHLFFSEIATQSPFTDSHYGFVAICRHFLPFVYMIGVIQIFIELLFPLSFIPLYFGFKDTITSSGKFLLWVWILFFWPGYWFLIEYDYVVARYFLISAFLFLPWIGNGISKLCEKANTSLYRKSIFFLIFLIFLTPTIRTLRLTMSRDITTTQAVHWLVENDKIGRVQIVSNDREGSLHIDLEVKADSDWKTIFFNRRTNPLSIEKYALKKNAEIIFLKKKTKDIDKIANFQFYHRISSFVGGKYTIVIYNRSSG